MGLKVSVDKLVNSNLVTMLNQQLLEIKYVQPICYSMTASKVMLQPVRSIKFTHSKRAQDLQEMNKAAVQKQHGYCNH